ncbi:SDR family NAD(P)-dependent oxidoreductase [Egbenema bharatensis]|uniref:SDR family NAD(P)-dependent oxidoreductase n=1 Tax=Egbenema bharatensis TaxID=3463334 RepID=UPI003A875B81
MTSQEKVAIVTAASQGIGRGCARELAAQGYRVALIARSSSILDLATELNGIAMQGSMTNPDDLQQLVTMTLDRWGRIDAVVNSFADPPRPDLLSISDDQWLEQFEMLFLSVVRLARWVTEPMQKQGGGAIVNISACDSQEPSLGTPFSGTLRAAMEGFTKLYAKRYRGDRIRMVSIAPFFVADSMDELEGWEVPELMLGRPVRYAELAKAVAFLLSDDARVITGTTLKVDEAYSAAI